ncbi:DEAD/DEAH box helicase [Aquimarina intermedia]|uniref:DEAD-box ATP-dependent RNA helicase RhpA n=1 Tax=Aquimarina intermedia TaxID=350814 RepID=A0A5S5CAE5_9FLAO|nr:DEAD/DEAH box helicase [Aquimarina intermedia]TYP74963.1 ATP-dependent RNA helicase RhlE [Aquimarina intermedia]
MSFTALGLSDALLKAISEKGYTKPSTIQEKAIPEILEGKDVLASAQTGTGKTAGFILPILQIITETKKQGKRPIRALVLTPTRELAAQILDNAEAYSKHLDIRSTVVFGGVNAKPQIRALRNGVDILVATPGRLLDLHSQKAFSLGRVTTLVLDEADRMLDMGFQRDINKILDLLPSKRQNLLFSATFSKEIKKLAGGILHHPVTVEAAPENSTAEKVKQRMYLMDKTNKAAAVIKLISDGNWKQVLIFTRTKHGANRLSEKLSKRGISAAAIHGNKSQGARTKALDGFKKGKIRVLVATDIAARGLDIPLLPHVINYELPNIAADYVHRIGRTGRAGASGEAISMVSHDEMEYVWDIEKLLGDPIDKDAIEGFEPLTPFPTTPTKNKSSAKKKSASNSGRKPRQRRSRNANRRR